MGRVSRLVAVAAFALIPAAACGGKPGAVDLAPTPEPGFDRSYLTPAVTDIVMLESAPEEVRLVVQGELPNPCARLGWYVRPGDDQGRVEVALYADQRSDAMCAQVIQPYSETILLGTFERGSYLVVVNDQPVETFTLP